MLQFVAGSISARFMRIATAGLMLLGVSVAGLAQYPGRIEKSDKNAPVLRSIAVLEWTGQPGKPSASRLVPISVFDGEQLNDGTLYLDRPQPLALDSGVEYVLQKDGRPTGLYDVFGAGEMSGTWQGVGVWKSLSTAAETRSKDAYNQSSLYNSKVDIGDDSDKPVLHRKHPKESDSGNGSSGSSGTGSPNTGSASTSGSGGSASTGSGGGSGSQADPDRPTLHRKSGSDSSTSSTSSTTSSSGSDSGSGSGSHEAVDPDRPTLRRHHSADDSDTAGVSNAPPDPDRPRLMHGKPADLEPSELPRLKGNPPAMQQVVAVSDSANRPVHPWAFSWSDPADQTHYKQQMEALARTALGMDEPATPSKTTKTAASKTAKTSTAKTTKKKTSLLATASDEPKPLADEQFQVYELAYGASATLVLTAATPKPELVQTDSSQQTASDGSAPKIVRRSTPGKNSATVQSQVKDDSSAPSESGLPAKPAPQKFVTLIAQPDLYGGVLVLYKSVTDSAHLDETPRMRLIDAVDATADNRAELLFELRGDGQRQFALYRVLRGSAEQMFATVAMP